MLVFQSSPKTQQQPDLEIHARKQKCIEPLAASRRPFVDQPGREGWDHKKGLGNGLERETP